MRMRVFFVRSLDARHYAREIREYFIPDFSEWKEHDKYKKAPFDFAQGKFERLLGDLKAGKSSG